MSFAALPEPFGVELVFDGEGMRAEPAELPESYGETKTERAVRAMQSFLETQRGTVVGRKELLEVAIKVANVRERAAKEALKLMLERLGDAVAITKLPGQGQPLAYRLKTEEETAPSPKDVTIGAPLHQMAKEPSGTNKSLGHTPLHQNGRLHQTFSTPVEVKELYGRFKARELKGRRLELPGRSYPDLERTLEAYFSRGKLAAGERADLLEIALTVTTEPEPVAG